VTSEGQAEPRTRIALVQQGDPTDPASWSGVPARLTRGFEQAGCEVVPVRASFNGAGRLASLLGMSWASQSASRGFAAVCGAIADHSLRRAERLDGIVMIGSGYRLHAEAPIVTFEDMTLVQALKQGEPPYDSLHEAGARRWRERQRRIYAESRGCCLASSWAAASVIQDYGIPAEKVHVVGLGRNIDVEPAERDWGVPRFLFVGADWRRKRGDAVLSAFATVRERHPEATLDLVGNHPPVDAAGVIGHGRLPLGSREGQRSYFELLRRATCFLMPSRHEPFGIAYLDAGASGLPSIGTTVGGAPEAIGEGGVVVDPDDPDALPTAMLRLAAPATARQLGERALRHAEACTWRATAERLVRALGPPGVDLDRLPPFLDPSPNVGRYDSADSIETGREHDTGERQ
jgi:glycosyltransferase involved in cell wall biosynthesis